MSYFPEQTPPVRRPELVRSEDLYVVREALRRYSPSSAERWNRLYVHLVHGYNFNDPQSFDVPAFHRLAQSGSSDG
ncbi:hypothetical protein [Amycolatopsis silviterrae]|uniref:Uncharacterized protein n=1 Tax=Amycolatopsis silviterrae TaxID=1656914 RepID=A0ABW5H765_9PSEU